MSDQHEDRVRARAHSLWENEGRPEGRALHHWLKAEEETGASAGPFGSAAYPSDVDKAAGPTHGGEDFGGHDAEAEGAAASGVGGQHYEPGTAPRQAGTNEAEVGEHAVRTGQGKPGIGSPGSARGSRSAGQIRP